MDSNDNGSKDKPSVSTGLRAAVLGVSLSLAGGVCATSTSAEAGTPLSSGSVRVMDINESEVFDSTLGAFQVFDREDPHQVREDKMRHRKIAQVAWRGCAGGRACR
jgi:hypothetical protein